MKNSTRQYICGIFFLLVFPFFINAQPLPPNVPPIAEFTYTLSGGSEINFDATESFDMDGTIVSWTWNFGDGTTGSGQTTSHTYTYGNTYTVTLTVTDNQGATGTQSQNVTPDIANAPPTAQFSFTPTGVIELILMPPLPAILMVQL
jgi:PKD repeat protein